MNYRNKNKPNCQNRKGILLLVVLSMLTLFLMIGTAYIVSASHYRKMNKTMAQAAEASHLEVDQTALLDQALLQLVRDTENEFSSIRFHSLLRDLYGVDGLAGTTADATWAGASNVTNGQMVTIYMGSIYQDLFGSYFDWNSSDPDIIDRPLSDIDNVYNLSLIHISEPTRPY